jgi:hypothetical protein
LKCILNLRRLAWCTIPRCFYCHVFLSSRSVKQINWKLSLAAAAALSVADVFCCKGKGRRDKILNKTAAITGGNGVDICL